MRDPVPLKLKPKPLDSFEDASPRLELALAASRRSRTFNNWASNLDREREGGGEKVSGCDSCGIEIETKKQTESVPMSFACQLFLAIVKQRL